MDHNLDLTLPSTAPTAYIDQRRTTDMLDAALYSLIPMSDDELLEVARACKPDYEHGDGDIVRPAPEPHFVSQPLRAVYESHMQLAGLEEFDPYYFIVIVKKDWKEKGVLLVTLQTDDEPPAIDSFMCLAEDAGSMVINLQIANTDWEEAKEGYEIGADGDGSDDDGDGNEEDGDQEVLPTDAEEGQSEDEGPEYPSKKPPFDYLIPIYILDSVDANTLISSLEDEVDNKPNPFTDYQIRSQASLKPTDAHDKDIKALNKPDPAITEDIVNQACALHPIRCRANKWLNKTYLLVCDNTQPSISGLVLIKLTWDGVTKARSKASLQELGTAAPRETRRLPGTSDFGIKYGYNMIADDSSIFARTHPAFGIFQLNEPELCDGVRVIDTLHYDRKSGNRYFVDASTYAEVRLSESSTAAPEEIELRWTLDEAVKRFPWFCYDNRFEVLFSRQYFVWVDHEKVKGEGVVIVRYDWDMDIERSERELWELKELDKVRTMKVPADEAMKKTFVAQNDGSDDWAWEAYTK